MHGSGDVMDAEVVTDSGPTDPQRGGSVEDAQETFVRLEQLRHEREEHQATEEREVIFDIADLSVLYGSFRAVRNVTLPVYTHEITALIGPSGCGKTTEIGRAHV